MDSVEKRISEKLGVRRELSGYTRIENGDVIYKASDYRELCEQLWDALLASERSREWVKVSDFGLPFPWRKYRIRLYDGSEVIAKLECNGEGYGALWHMESGELQPISAEQVTHWQPLPALPSEGEQNV